VRSADPAGGAGFVLRAARPGDEDAVAGLTAQAFSDASHRAGPADAWPHDPAVLRRVAERTADGALLATATLRLAGQGWGGRIVPAAALAGVAVDLTARGHGVGAALLADAFAAARAAGALVVALIPSTHAFYRRSGCGTAGRRPVYAIGSHQLRALPRPAVRLVHRAATPADAPAVAALVAARSVRGNGGLAHDVETGGAQFVSERAGRVVGWCALQRRPSTRSLYTVVVHDLVAADAEAELAIWRDLVADEPSASQVHALLPTGGLLEHHLPRQTEPVEDSTWMLGLLDVPGALAARGYPAGVSARVRLDVDGTATTLHVAGGTGRTGPGDGGADVPTARLTAADLASVYAGHLDPVAAAHAGILTADPSTAGLLRTLFAGPPAVLDRPF